MQSGDWDFFIKRGAKQHHRGAEARAQCRGNSKRGRENEKCRRAPHQPTRGPADAVVSVARASGPSPPKRLNGVTRYS